LIYTWVPSSGSALRWVSLDNTTGNLTLDSQEGHPRVTTEPGLETGLDHERERLLFGQVVVSDAGGAAAQGAALRITVNVTIAVEDVNEPPIVQPREVFLPEKISVPTGGIIQRGQAAVASAIQANWTDFRYTGFDGSTPYASRLAEYDRVLPSLDDHLAAAVQAFDPDFP